MKVTTTEGPYPSTILQLSPDESYTQGRIQVHAVTVIPPSRAGYPHTPQTACYYLSGTKKLLGRQTPWTSAQQGFQDISFLPEHVRGAVTQQLQRYIQNPPYLSQPTSVRSTTILTEMLSTPAAAAAAGRKGGRA